MAGLAGLLIHQAATGETSQSTSRGMTNGQSASRVLRQRDQHHGHQHGQERADPHLHEELPQAAPGVPPAVRGEIPDEQSSPGDEQADGRAQDGVEIDQRVVRQQYQPEQRAQERLDQPLAGEVHVQQPLALGGFAHQLQRRGHQRRQEQRPGGQQRPQPRRSLAERPSADAQRHQGGRHQAAAQVVPQLPDGEEGQRVAAAACRRVRGRGGAASRPVASRPWSSGASGWPPWGRWWGVPR